MGSEGGSSTSPPAAGGATACCAVCGGAASVYCAADAAALCLACDAAVHAANPLASRHQRVPLSSMAAAAAASGVYDVDLFAPDDDIDAAAVASSWPPHAYAQGSPQNGISSSPSATSFTTASEYSCGGADGRTSSLFDLLSDVDLAAAAAACVTASGAGGGYLVPDGVGPPPLWAHAHPGLAAAWTSTAWSPADAAAAASVVVIPGAGVVAAPAAEREARVQRYREKRKNRRFQKTIRYASRKAYAEARPRIKGRFVKRAGGGNGNSSSSSSDGAAAAGASEDSSGSDATTDAAAKFWLSFSDDVREDGVGFYVDAAGAYGVVPSF